MEHSLPHPKWPPTPDPPGLAFVLFYFPSLSVHTQTLHLWNSLGRESRTGTLPGEPWFFPTGIWPAFNTDSSRGLCLTGNVLFPLGRSPSEANTGSLLRTRGTTDKGTWSSLSLHLTEFLQIKTKWLFLEWTRRKYASKAQMQSIHSYLWNIHTQSLRIYWLRMQGMKSELFLFYSELF